jgi:hypothetical protein
VLVNLAGSRQASPANTYEPARVKIFITACLEGFFVLKEDMPMITESSAIAEEWLTGFWGQKFDPDVVDKLAAINMTLIYSLHEPCRGTDQIRNFMLDFRKAFLNLEFRRTSEFTANGDCILCRWEGSGVHGGPPFGNFIIGAMPQPTERRMFFSGTTILRFQEGKIAEEIRFDDADTSLRNLRLLTSAN